MTRPEFSPPVDVFSEKYWMPFSESIALDAPTPAKQPTMKSKAIYNAYSQLKALEIAPSVPPPAEILSPGEYFNPQQLETDTLIKFNREQLTLVGADDMVAAHALLEKVRPFNRLVGVESDIEPYNYPEADTGIHWAGRYVSQEGYGLVLDTVDQGKSVFGVKKLEAAEEIKAKTVGLRALVAFVQGLASWEAQNSIHPHKHRYVNLRLPLHLPSKVGATSMTVNLREGSESSVITYERLNSVGYYPK
ncbi:MAG: hypothetical protein JWO96_150 [Candidatus Saccharibacteria bacterium]|nr:hypothetical protein [Candidatus Saccharibacteria bacterium]